MRVSAQQRTFIVELFARANRDGEHRSALGALDRDDFLATVDRAARDAEEASQTARQLTTWAIRLLPYFERSHELTVEQAHEAYLRDRGEAETLADAVAGIERT